MNRYRTNKIDLVLTFLMLLAITLCMTAIYYRELIESSIKLDLSPSILTLFIGAYFLLFRLFAKKSEQIDSLKIQLAHITSRRKQNKSSKLELIRSQIVRHQKASIVFVGVVTTILCVVWVTEPSYSKMIVVVGSTLFFFNIIAHGRVYFQLDTLISDINVEITKFVFNDNERIKQLAILVDDSTNDPISKSEHLDGYLTKHSH